MKRKRFTLYVIRRKLVVKAVTIAGYLKNNGRKNRDLNDGPEKMKQMSFIVMDSDYEIKLFI